MLGFTPESVAVYTGEDAGGGAGCAWQRLLMQIKMYDETGEVVRLAIEYFKYGHLLNASQFYYHRLTGY